MAMRMSASSVDTNQSTSPIAQSVSKRTTSGSSSREHDVDVSPIAEQLKRPRKTRSVRHSSGGLLLGNLFKSRNASLPTRPNSEVITNKRSSLRQTSAHTEVPIIYTSPTALEADISTSSSQEQALDASTLVDVALNLSRVRNRQVSASARRISDVPSRRDISDAAATAAGPDGEAIPQHFSDATLSRAERARTHFEVAHEYRRLLDNLPSPSTGLGRQYNPLLSLRNRAARRAAGQTLQPSPAVFANANKVREYVDNVEVLAQRGLYRTSHDLLWLPQLPDAAESQQDTTPYHVTPMELFADTLWSERAEHHEAEPVSAVDGADEETARPRSATTGSRITSATIKRRYHWPLHRHTSDYDRKSRKAWHRHGHRSRSRSLSSRSSDNDLHAPLQMTSSPELVSPATWEKLKGLESTGSLSSMELRGRNVATSENKGNDTTSKRDFVSELAQPRSSIDTKHSHLSGPESVAVTAPSFQTADGGEGAIEEAETQQTVTKRDVAHVRALFAIPGIKASEIRRLIVPKPRDEETLSSLRTELEAFGQDLNAFDVETSRDQRLQHSKKGVTALTAEILSITEDADAFISDVNARHTLAVKQVNDNIDDLMRMRRGELRWLRSLGYALLERLVLALMWVVWLVVVIIRLTKSILRKMLQTGGWLLCP